MTGEGDILSRGAKLHPDTDLMDEIPRSGANDMSAQNAIGFGINDQFDKSLRGQGGLGAAIAHELEFAGFVFAALGLELVLSLTDIGNLGGGIDDAWDDIVIHMSGLAGDHFDGGHAFVFGFVRQHRAGDTIANGINPFDIGLPMRIGFDLPARR